MEEQGSKENTIGSAGPSGLEVVLTLLAKTVIIHMQVFIIEIGEPSFEGLFARTRPVILFQQLDDGCISFQELLTQLLSRTWNWSRKRSQSLSPRDKRRRNGSIATFGEGS